MIPKRNARYAPHRSFAGKPPALVKKYNMVLIACGTLAARCWLPQALALLTFRDIFIEQKRLRCDAVRCVALLRHTYVRMMETRVSVRHGNRN